MFTADQYNKWRLIILVMLLVAVLLAVFCAALYIGVRSIMLERVQLHATDVAVLVSVILRDESDAYKELIDTMDAAMPQYASMCGMLRDLKDINNVLYLYTERQVNDTQAQYILDGDEPSSDMYCPLGLVNKIDANKRAAFNAKKPVHYDGTINDEYGVYMTAYAPIIAPSTGELLGFVGVDVDTTREDALLNVILRTLIIASCVILIVLYAIMLRFSGSILAPIYKDSLTGAHNRRFFERFLRASLLEAERQKRTLAVLMLDLDFFKLINDTYGHPFGDTVLTQVAHIVGYNLRKSDCLARFGGEEFIAALPNIGRDEASIVAERIRMSVEGARIFNNALNNDVSVTVSIGVAVAYNCTFERIVSNADQALYYSKANGRNRVTLYYEQPPATEEHA